MKLSFLSLCFSALLFFASCTKEDVPPSGNNQSDNYSVPVSVTASNWASASSMTWSDAAATSNASINSTWEAPELTEEMVNNGAVLIYARTLNSEAPKLLPVMFEKTSNTEFDLYKAVAGANVIHLSHTIYKDDTFTTPTSVNNDASFRYILINNMPPANGRIATNSGFAYNLEALKAMSYREIVAFLGINE